MIPKRQDEQGSGHTYVHRRPPVLYAIVDLSFNHAFALSGCLRNPDLGAVGTRKKTGCPRAQTQTYNG